MRMEQINEIEKQLITWCKMASENKAFTKDFSIDEKENCVIITITTEEITRLYKTYKAVCDIDVLQVKKAIELLEEKKNELL